LLPLPSGLTINYAKANALATSTSALGIVGSGRVDAGNSFSALPFVQNSGAYVNKVGVVLNNDTTNITAWGSSLGTFANSSVNFSITARIPIAEWAGNGTVNLGAGAQVEYAFNASTTTSTDTTNFGYGPTGALFYNFAPAGTASVDKRVRFQYPIQNDDELVVEVQESGTGTWVPLIARLGSFFSNSAGTVYYGCQLVRVSGSSTDVDVVFYSLMPSLGAWSGINTWRWRVRKAKASSPVGYGKANSTEFGLVAPRRGHKPWSIWSVF